LFNILTANEIKKKGITPLGPLPDILPLDEEVNAVKAATA
jgi:putative glutathione S-transferase